jgi:hypothetical protein
MSYNFMDMLELVSNKPVTEKKITCSPNGEYTPLLQEEIEDINEFYTAISLKLKNAKNVVEIIDDGRWMYFKNLTGVFWYNPRTSIYAGYFKGKIPFNVTLVDDSTYTVMIGNPECKALFLKRLINEYYDQIDYKYVGNTTPLNIKHEVNKILSYDEPLELRLYRLRQLHELSCVKVSTKPAKITKEELIEEENSKR